MYPLFVHLFFVLIIVFTCAQGAYADTADDFLSKLEKAINAATPTQTGAVSTGTTTTTPKPTQTTTTTTGSAVTTQTTPVTPKLVQTPTSTATPVTPKPAQTSTGTVTPVAPKPGTGNTATPVTRRETLATTNGTETSGQAGSTGLSLNSASGAPVCNLPEVQSVVVREFPDKSTIRWASVLGAAGYDVLKKTTSGDFILVERVKDPVYTLYLAAGDIKYDHFKIAAVCPESGTTSPRTSIVTKVRTGPELLLLGMFASLLGAGALFIRRKRVS